MQDSDRLIRQARLRLEEARTLLVADLFEGCVARAYYAAFTAARAMLASDGSFPKSHAGVISEFGRRYVRTGVADAKLRTSLVQLESKRNLADYGSGGALGKADAERAIAAAESLIGAAEGYLI